MYENKDEKAFITTALGKQQWDAHSNPYGLRILAKCCANQEDNWK